jgi:hypothetical protein
MESVNWAALALGLAFFSNVTSAAGWVYAWNVNRNRATAKDIGALDRRLTIAESRLAGLPTNDGLHQVDLRLREAVGELKAMNVKLDGQTDLIERLERVVERHEQHLLGKS